jgi:hypothetical protein
MVEGHLLGAGVQHYYYYYIYTGVVHAVLYMLCCICIYMHVVQLVSLYTVVVHLKYAVSIVRTPCIFGDSQQCCKALHRSA